MNFDRINELVESARNYEDHECGMPKDDAVKIILATLRVFGCRPGTFAEMYASEALADAIGAERAAWIIDNIRHRKAVAERASKPSEARSE